MESHACIQQSGASWKQDRCPQLKVQGRSFDLDAGFFDVNEQSTRILNERRKRKIIGSRPKCYTANERHKQFPNDREIVLLLRISLLIYIA